MDDNSATAVSNERRLVVLLQEIHLVGAVAAELQQSQDQHLIVSILFLGTKGLTTERSVQNPFGIPSGSIRALFGPNLDQNFRSQKYKISKIFRFLRPSPPQRGPSSRRSALRRPGSSRTPATAATAAQIRGGSGTTYAC